MKNVSAAPPHPAVVVACLFCSGLCALVYQTVWLREFRLIFGASTASTAAVSAVFMGGVGLGSFFLGRKADRWTNPFRTYGRLEWIIALCAAMTPLLLVLANKFYLALGGTFSLGMVVGTLLRLALAAIILAGPTFLMGGTLPAAVRAVRDRGDTSRRRVAWLYAANTFGAVTGAMLATFWMLEHFGNRLTLWVACALNLAVGLLACFLARRCPDASESAERPLSPPAEGGSKVTLAAPAKFVCVAAALAGFVFFLLELVWYRMLSPLLGGSSFSFGLILAVALLGIGVGSAIYGARRANGASTLRGFAVVCALEALCVAVPYALGDRLAVLAVPFGRWAITVSWPAWANGRCSLGSWSSRRPWWRATNSRCSSDCSATARAGSVPTRDWPTPGTRSERSLVPWLADSASCLCCPRRVSGASSWCCSWPCRSPRCGSMP